MTRPTAASSDRTGEISPSRKWYLLAAALLLVGIAVFLAALIPARQQLHRRVRSMQRVVMPGEARVQLDEPGRYTVYVEKRSRVNGHTYEAPASLTKISNIAKILLKVRGPNGEVVETKRPENAHMYPLERYAGTGFRTFRASQAGTYQLTVPPPEDGAWAKLVLAVGEPDLAPLMSRIVGLRGAGGVLAVLFVAAAVLALLTFTSRVHAKAHLAEAR